MNAADDMMKSREEIRRLKQELEEARREIERLKPIVDMGGYIPCPDHRIPPDAKWENVQYYCERFRKTFG